MNQENQNNGHAPWNKGKLIGQKSPLKLKEIWAIHIRLQMAKNTRELALFKLVIGSKLRGCDLVKLKVCDVAQGGRVAFQPPVLVAFCLRTINLRTICESSRFLRINSTHVIGYTSQLNVTNI